ncbi:uncharacterized protein LOC109820976 [Asparagus officinalis]|uniref:uncharacterized protein LOC109820976 n=1 Tax=Asparagus officinalis TaxID=4686 RepID=UPI00098E418D|nr:uncharacterized protein LOC109820976 [Asparagus officinalis]
MVQIRGKKDERARIEYIERIYNGFSDSCVNYIRMGSGAFVKLASIMRNNSLLKDSRNVTVKEQLIMTLNILGHKSKNRCVRSHFIRSGETVSRYFNKDCIGMIDGTHVDAMLPINLVARFRGHKGVTQNVLAACTPNKLFTYVLAGKYYLCDAGYPTMQGFISPYQGVRYHLKEHSGKTPKNRRKLFNLRHSSLRSKIESVFGTLNNRFKILCAKPHFPFPIQVDIVLACSVLHNFITIVDLSDELLNDDQFNKDIDGEVAFENDTNLVDFTQNQTQREQTESRNEWKTFRDDIAWAIWVDYCDKYNHGVTIET